MKIATRPSVRATTPTNAIVRRAWNVRGTRRRPMRASVRPPPSAFGEGVADTAHRLDACRRGGIVLDLVAQVAHVDVDRLLVLVERLVVAEQLEQLGPGGRAAGPRGERVEGSRP